MIHHKSWHGTIDCDEDEHKKTLASIIERVIFIEILLAALAFFLLRDLLNLVIKEKW